MEISKSLQEEILAVQNKLKNAIRDHQVCVGKLKDDPNNTDILGQIQKIHLHIVSLGRCQKQVVQRLRKEVEAFKTENANGAKLSIASLLGLNNNNHITNNNETKLKTGTNEFNTKSSSKEDYEEIVRNGDVPSPTQDTPPAKERPSSVEMISGEDDVIEVSMDENSNEKQEEPEQKSKDETTEKVGFLCNLGLITNSKYTELQNKRAERKRRSTANPQFVYSSLEVPTKRKRHSYLQSGGNAPQTRQTTARMNGPSPPPAKVAPAKSASPPTRTVMKSLIPVQKSTTRPNILRSVVESKVFVSKPKVENGPSQIQLPVPSSKSVQIVGNKAVHIPGLPSSLTIERIGTDSAVCISCRNPGTLTVCENCTSNYHLSCHTISPAPPRICPKCALLGNEEGEDGEEEEEEDRRLPTKKDEELAAASNAPGIIRKAREDTEVYKATCGFHKADAAQKKRGLPAALSINQLPPSTFLIPISSNNVPTSSINQPEAGTSTTISGEQRESAAVSYPSLVLNQLPRSSIAYVQTEAQVPYTYQLPVSNSQQSEKHQRQSYLIVKKITEPAARRTSESSEGQSHSSVLNYQLPTTSGYKPRISSEISVTSSPVHYGKQLPDDIGRNRKKQANRAVPALNRIVHAESLPITTDYHLERSNTKSRKSRARQSRIKFSTDQLRSARATEILLPSHDADEPDEQLQVTKPSKPEEASIYGSRKYKPAGTGGPFHSLFASHNKSYIVADSAARESRNLEPADEDRPTVFRQQQLYHQDYQLEPGESNESTVQLQRGALTKFFEHVKLEEAHLPAPPRAKLVHKDGAASERDELGVSEIANDNDGGYITASKAPLSPTGTYEDDDSVENKTKQNSWTSSAIIMNKCQREESSTKNTEPAESIDSVAMKPDDFIPYEHKHSNAYVRIQCNSEDGMENVMDDAFGPESALLRRSDSFTEIVTENWRERHGSLPKCNAQSNLLELRKEVSVPDDKADTEKQDLSSGRRSSSSTNGSSNASSSNESDTPEQAMHDSIERSRRRLRSNEYEERLDISAVSPESMQVLEQFESAMLESDRSNAATC